MSLPIRFHSLIFICCLMSQSFACKTSHSRSKSSSDGVSSKIDASVPSSDGRIFDPTDSTALDLVSGLAVDAWRKETESPEDKTATAMLMNVDANFDENEQEYLPIKSGWTYKFKVMDYYVAVSMPEKTIQITNNPGRPFIGLFLHKDLLAEDHVAFAEVDSWIESITRETPCFKKGSDANIRPSIRLSGAVRMPKPSVIWEILCSGERAIFIKDYYTGKQNN